jgi:flagellar hook-basal body complex protein FliE
VLTASRADLAFRLVREVRNRMISSYEEIMRMQI